MTNALNHPFRRLAHRLGLEPHETRLLALMGALVATLMCAYTVAKVLRDAMFLMQFGALSLPYAYVGVAFVSAIAVWFEGQAARRFSRVGASRLNQYGAIAFSAAAAAFYPLAPHRTAALFYLWTGSQALMLLPHFWVLALDVWDSRRARRVFPVLSGFGLLGGLAGGGIASWSVPMFRRSGLMWILCGLLVLAHLLSRVAERHRSRQPSPVELIPAMSRWQMILRSRYLRVFAAGLALSVIVSTLVDFQFKYYLQHHYPDPHSLTRFLGRFYIGLNATALLFQFGVAGWLIQRFGLAASTGLQPTSIILFSTWAAVSAGWWAVLAMRWVQGVVFQTLGKSSAEIYYFAIRASERRWIKPAVDTLVERWSDGLVGVLLIVALHSAHVPIAGIAAATAVLAAAWFVLLVRLDRQHGNAYRLLLSSHRVEPEEVAASLREPAARRAVLQALGAEDERSVLLALKLVPYARDPGIAHAVRACLGRDSPSVRTAAVEAMTEMRLPDRERTIDAFVGDPHEPLCRAAVTYKLLDEPPGGPFVRRALAGDDPALRAYVVDALFEHPSAAAGALTWEWIDARLASGRPDELVLAARALGAMTGRKALRRLGSLLDHAGLEVRRAALVTAARRPQRGLLARLVPLLTHPQLAHEARRAVAAVGDVAIVALRPLVGGARGEQGQASAASVLASIPSPRAAAELLRLVRSGDVLLRDIGLRSLARLRVRAGRAVVRRSAAHRLFLRELHDYRDCLEPALALASHPAPEVRLLADSFGESADLALQRAIEALVCAYEPAPLLGVYARLRSRERGAVSPALDYLGTILPRPVFKIVTRMFEPDLSAQPEGAAPDRGLAAYVRKAWSSDDAWLRACAVRVARVVPEENVLEPRTVGLEHSLVEPELAALAREQRQRPDAGARRAAGMGASAC